MESGDVTLETWNYIKTPLTRILHYSNMSKHFIFPTLNYSMGNSKRTPNEQRSDVNQTHENNNPERQAMLDNRSRQINKKQK